MPRRLIRRNHWIYWYGPPTVVILVALYILQRATVVGPPSRDRAYVCGVLLLVAVAGFLTRRCYQRRSWETSRLEREVERLNRKIRSVEADLAETREDVRSQIAMETWIEAADRADAHRRKGWVHLNKDR